VTATAEAVVKALAAQGWQAYGDPYGRPPSSGPTILPPGKHKFSIRVAGMPPQSEEVEIGAGETWGILIGPGGVLPLQAY
jgi:hypothetical protein